MLKIFWAILPLLCVSVFYLECINPVSHDYSVEQNGDLSELLIFCDGPNIFGVDTTEFSIKAHLRISNAVFGGAAKLPNGGIAVTHASNTYRNGGGSNGGGHTLYVIDKNCTLQGTYDICVTPMEPTVINNLLFIGSAWGGFQILDANNFSLKKEFSFPDMVDGWEISHRNGKAYLGINPPVDYPVAQYSYIVELDLNTLDTAIITDTTNFFLDTHLFAERYDLQLYIFNRLNMDICIYDLDTRTVRATAEVSKYPAITAMQAQTMSRPRIYNGYLYVLYGEPFYDVLKQHVVKFDMNTLEYISHVSLTEFTEGWTGGRYITYQGRFVVRYVRDGLKVNFVLFEDMETGRVEHRVTLSGE